MLHVVYIKYSTHTVMCDVISCFGSSCDMGTTSLRDKIFAEKPRKENRSSSKKILSMEILVLLRGELMNKRALRSFMLSVKLHLRDGRTDGRTVCPSVRL